jgi:hypothetical protein
MTSAQTAIFRWVMGIVAAVIAGVIVFEFTHGGAGVTPVDYSGMYDGQTVGAPNGGTVQLQVNEASTASGSTTAEITWGGSLNGSGPCKAPSMRTTLPLTVNSSPTKLPGTSKCHAPSAIQGMSAANSKCRRLRPTTRHRNKGASAPTNRKPDLKSPEDEERPHHDRPAVTRAMTR